MKRIILFAALILTTITIAQTSYEVKPGSKGNQIVIQLVNISEIENLKLIKPVLLNEISNLEFEEQSEDTIALNPKEEKEAVYNFDVKFNADISKVDTLEFLISDGITINQIKKFILSYTAPTEYNLAQNYPNPFNPVTKIRYSIPTSPQSSPSQGEDVGIVTLRVYDILGSEVATLVNEQKPAGNYEVDFNANQFSSGVYIYRIKAGDYVNSKKMILLK